MGGTEKILLVSADGDQAEIHLHGAQVTSWIPARRGEYLFLSPKTSFGEKGAIRGGIPVIFPQFCAEGPLVKHGFARRTIWKLGKVENGGETACAVFGLLDNEYTRQIWDYAFSAEICITIGNGTLETALRVINTGEKAFTFTGALHTYLQIEDIQRATVEGLQGIDYFESGDRQTRLVQKEKTLRFNSEIDRFYMNANQALSLRTPNRQLGIEMDGFSDVVIWNPWIEGARRLGDLEDQAYLQMLCVEAALIENPVTLQPTETWRGLQLLKTG